MRRSAKLRPDPRDLLVAAVIVLAAAALGAALWGRASAGTSGSGLTAVVCVGGQETDRVELSALPKPETRVYHGSGHTLTVRFSPSGAQVVSADCPNQDCVRTGLIDAPGRSIVCLPARISIQLTAADGGGVDAVIG
ncbi:MAG: NusG domain II-containing protein [Oscillibacter sp.]|jgi:hypothetical protein|nr:NusG domain II-containing protein [Oscillibacter sp.]